MGKEINLVFKLKSLLFILYLYDFISEVILMKNDFDKFKKKILMEHLAYSILLAFCAGLVFSGLALMILILAYKNAPAFAYPVIVSAAGIIAAAVAFVFLFRRKKPSDDEIALRIDDSLGMQEKFANMVEFKNEYYLRYEIV